MKFYIVVGDNFLERKEFIDSLIADNSVTVKNGLDPISWSDVLVEIESGGGLFNTSSDILVKNFSKIKKNAKAEDEFLEFIKNSLNNFDGILILEDEKVDKKRKFNKEIVKFAKLQEFKLPYDNQMPGWIKNRAKKVYGLEIDEESSNLLKMLCTNIFEADSELKKLKIYLGEKVHVDVPIISQVVGAHRAESIFEIQNAILDKNLNYIVKIYNNLIENGESPEYIISIILSLLNKIIFISFSQNMAINDIASSIGMNPYILKKNNWVGRVSKNYNTEELVALFDRFIDLEYKIKSGQLKNSVLIDNLIYGFC